MLKSVPASEGATAPTSYIPLFAHEPFGEIEHEGFFTVGCISSKRISSNNCDNVFFFNSETLTPAARPPCFEGVVNSSGNAL